MKSFIALTGIAAPFPDADVDTDVIFPARFLLLLDRAGLGRHLFHERRAQAPRKRAFRSLSRSIRQGRNPGGRSQLRLRLEPRTSRLGASRFRHPLRHRPELRRDLLRQLLSQRHAADHAHRCRAWRRDARRNLRRPADRRSESAGDSPVRGARDRLSDRSAPARDGCCSGSNQIGEILAGDAADIKAFESRQKTAAPWLYLDPQKLSYFDDLGSKDQK